MKDELIKIANEIMRLEKEMSLNELDNKKQIETLLLSLDFEELLQVVSYLEEKGLK